jgi:CRISPR-associated protein Csy1
MLDPAIQEFLDKQKEQWLTSRIKGNTTEEEVKILNEQAADKFHWPTWLVDASQRAGQLFIASHPGKFSHPEAKPTPINCEAKAAPDGFLRSGNVEVEADVFGNSSALDVEKFLSTELADKQTILSHLEENSSEIEENLTVETLPYDKIRAGLLAIKQANKPGIKTSGRIKQVYFPVSKTEYHLLSILTPSNIMYRLKGTIQEIRFSELAKEVREARRENVFHEVSLDEFYNLTAIGYGGANAHNISVLNYKNNGTALLLPCLPPELPKRPVQPPVKDFFIESLWIRAFEKRFQSLHKVFVSQTNNDTIRQKRDRLLKSLFYQVADRLWVIRSLDEAWSNSAHYEDLPHYQKIWLDQMYEDSREEDPSWFSPVKQGLLTWFTETYSELFEDKAVDLGISELRHIEKMVDECQEALR